MPTTIDIMLSEKRSRNFGRTHDLFKDLRFQSEKRSRSFGRTRDLLKDLRFQSEKRSRNFGRTRNLFKDLHVQSEKRDSNPRPPPWQGGALPAELFSRL